MKSCIDGISLPEALRDLSDVIYYSVNPDERSCYGDKIDFCLRGLRVGGYVAVWIACDNPAVELGDQVERFVPCGALDATIHRLWHDYDCESRGLAPPSRPRDNALRLPDRLRNVAALLDRYDEPSGREPAHPRPTEVLARVCTTTRDAEPPWWGWDGSTLILCRVGMRNRVMAHPVPRFDENLSALLSAVGIAVDHLDPHPEARGDDFLSVLLNSAALRKRDRIRCKISSHRTTIRHHEKEIEKLWEEIAQLEDKLRKSE